MNRIIITLSAILLTICWGVELSAQAKRGKVEFSADVMRPVTIPGTDSSAYSLVGNVVFYHNGAVITCDSAVRYGERRMECFRNVIINQDSIYVYGDRADYNGLTNTARVYSHIIKVKDGDATLYTRRFSFNTLNNVGSFTNGGILRQKGNKIEAMRGYYYASTHDLMGSEMVEMEDSTYKISSDSIRYNTDNQTAYFFRNTRVWNNNGDFMSADKGSYDTRNGFYMLTKNAYILTANQELMADTAWYDSKREYAELHSNIQAYDQQNLSFAFGDLATYDKPNGERLLLTKNPSVAGFEREGADTMYMRADTILIYTEMPEPIDTVAVEDVIDSLGVDMMPEDSISSVMKLDTLAADSIRLDTMLNVAVDSTAVVADSVANLSIDTVTVATEDSSLLAKPLTDKEIREAERAAEKARRAELKAQRRAEKEAKKQAAREAKEQRRKERMERLKEKIRLRQLKRGDSTLMDSLAVDSLKVDSTAIDSLKIAEVVDSLSLSAVDSLQTDSVAVKAEEPLRRLLHGYYDVRVFRKDIQAVCDSVVGYSIDSTMHMFGTPIIWSEKNQITSGSVVLYTKNQKLDKAEFIDEPIMASEIDTSHYNQITGREMYVFFRDNDIYKVDVEGNAQTYYYMMDSTDIVGFLVAECANMTFIIDQRRIQTITFREQPVYTAYPMDKIPDTQSELLPHFQWYGDRRPDFAQVFNRTIRPQLRKKVERYKKPRFPIASGIDAQRRQMQEQNLWIDRDDKLPVEAMEFLREIGAKRVAE